MIIEAQGLGHAYGEGSTRRIVLEGVDVQLTERRIGVIGHNGSGKSTFLRMLNGLVLPSEGKLLVNGMDTAKDAKAIRKLVGFLFTDPDNQIIMPTVAEDVAFGLRKSGLPAEEVNRRVDELLDRFGLLGHRDHPAQLLSGGQKQLQALAAVLITQPEMIVMDEPTTLLDIRNANEIGRIINTVEATVVLATHHLHLLEDFDRVLVFDHGHLVADGDPATSVARYRALMEA
ncbi:MAG: energy-coupling factor ABC transporter ATP-binding protein [Luteococcus sp.]|uniref:energy-coupling factor ABC transporter ATP-binding protein n=1 Tax=Luteococcus sp. TaxID=1969402 RepID=UPI0026477D39|nr:ABC transporter ATP-binding protein [Luteococcus sp.]MDN5564258.1 energy-coupling factor ABC transporter ATP-binding protein [Luteococcus sp.]